MAPFFLPTTTLGTRLLQFGLSLLMICGIVGSGAPIPWLTVGNPFREQLERDGTRQYQTFLRQGDFFKVRVECTGSDLDISLRRQATVLVQGITPLSCPQAGIIQAVVPATGAYSLSLHA